jgi:hypothetical protein
MASTLDKQQSAEDTAAVATIDERELREASEDPRVRAFFEEAEEYVRELEREGRNL